MGFDHLEGKEFVGRLTLFVKGNVDVHDSLHSCRIAGRMVWNGINEVLRTTHPGWTARLKHETWTRSDGLLASDGKVPAELEARRIDLGSYPAASQFSHALFETKADAIVLTLQPDIGSSLVRHKRDGFLIYAGESRDWTPENQQWLRTEFEPVPSLTLEQSMTNLETIVEKIREKSEAPVLVYNLSPITPGEAIHCYQGFDETYSTRIRRFNVGLVDLSRKTGISIIDVDSLLARKGADELKLDTLHFTPPAYRLVAEEVVRVLADLGVLDEGKA